MRTYDLTNHIMVDLEIVIVSATMAFIIGTNLYEILPMDERDFHGFIKQ